MVQSLARDVRVSTLQSHSPSTLQKGGAPNADEIAGVAPDRKCRRMQVAIADRPYKDESALHDREEVSPDSHRTKSCRLIQRSGCHKKYDSKKTKKKENIK